MSSTMHDPFEIVRARRNIDAGESQIGVNAAVVERFVRLKITRMGPPSSQLAWSAKLNLTRRTPDGLHATTDEGEKVVGRRAGM